MASGTGGFDAKPVAGWAEEHADGHFAHRATRHEHEDAASAEDEVVSV